MDRRSFLTLLGAVGVLTGLPSWLRDPRTAAALAPGIDLPDDDDVSAWLAPSDLAVLGRPSAKTFEFYASHLGSVGSGIAAAEMLRLPEDGGHTILRVPMAPGGIVRWIAALGQEIYGPIRIVVPEIVRAHVIGTDALGRIVMASKDGVVPMRPV